MPKVIILEKSETPPTGVWSFLARGEMIKKTSKVLFFFVCVVFLFGASGCFGPSQGELRQVEIKKVVDGDTVELSDGQLARYIGIDCPEIEKKTSTGWVEVNEPFAQQAKKANEELVLKGPVFFESDITRKDKYNRLLVYCYVDDNGQRAMVQSELLRAGLAYLYTFPPNVKYTDVLAESLEDARENKRGVWSLDLDIDSKDAKQFIGLRRLAVGRVENAFSTPKTVCLKLKGLSIVIFNNDMDTFLKKGIDPVVYYKDKVVRVFGLIKKYKGRPEIIVAHPSQIEIISRMN